jgi:hypothetical protein
MHAPASTTTTVAVLAIPTNTADVVAVSAFGRNMIQLEWKGSMDMLKLC